MYITQNLRRAMQIHGNDIATVDGERCRTWQQFGQRVAQLAGALQWHGLSKDGRVAILALNSDRYLETFFATHWANGIFVPLNVRLAPQELVYMLNDAGVHTLFVDDAFQSMLPAFAGKEASVTQVIYMGNGAAPDSTLDYETILAESEPVDDALRGGDEIAGIFYTGGTTGVPKGVMLTHANLIFNALNTLAYLYQGDPWTYLHAAPMFHAADGISHMTVTMVGGTHVFIPKFDPRATLQAVERHSVTHTVMVPTMINMLVNHPSLEDYDLSSLAMMVYGGSPMSEALQRRFQLVLPGCNMIQAYAQTELSPIACFLEPKYHIFEGPLSGKTQSGGRPLLSVEVKIVDVEEQEAPRGEIGEIVSRGPHVMAGYWNKPEATAAAIKDGWMFTGDAGYMDDNGFVFVVDRVKDMIITGGENVYSAEVENVLYQHPGVALCAVIGIPSEEWGEQVHAVILPKEGVDLDVDEIIGHCRQRIANYKRPRSVEIRNRGLPMSGAGKILKAELRKPYWATESRMVN